MYSKYKTEGRYLYGWLETTYIMESMTFPAKIMKPMRVTIPEAVKDVLGLETGDLVEVTVRKLKKSETDKPIVPETKVH